MRTRFRIFHFALVFILITTAFLVFKQEKTVLAYTTDNDVFINEIHYDNDGIDTGEFVEIAGPAGTDLTGWSIVLYNGNGGANYYTQVLSATIPDQQNGFGTVSINAIGFQNGSPDGLALVKPDNSVVMFLSYEGTFTAVGGPADGLLSTDIGVFEPGDSLIGGSLQLIGNGDSYADFSWSGPITATRDNVNTGQTFEIIVNEPIFPTCPAYIWAPDGTATADLSAVDEDGIVISSSITSSPVTGLSIINETPASEANGTYTATFDVADTAAAGFYDVEVTFSNDDSTPQTATCQIHVAVDTICPFEDSHTIPEVQGSGATTPFAYEPVTVSGIVTGAFQGAGSINGFFIQDPVGDGDSATSDGIFIYELDDYVLIGDYVQVTGTAREYFNKTQISASDVTVCSSGNLIPDAAEISLPIEAVSDFEKYEGMLVTIPQALTISEYFNFDRYGEIILTTEKFNTPTALYEPGSLEYDTAVAEYELSKITLDDGRNAENPDPAIHPNGLEFTLDNLFRGGDIVENVTGVMDYSYSLYRIQPTQGADYTPVNPRPVTHDDVGGNLKVASFNVLNYFTTLDSRGADTAEEFTRQRDKIIAAIAAIDADVVGLIEIENNTAAIADLVSGLNDVVGAGTYTYVDTGTIGTDQIKVAFIHKPATVSLVGDYAILDNTYDPNYRDDYNRPALAQTFQPLGSSELVTIAVNHLKSKGSDCDDIGDPDLGDGAGNCNLTRTAAAEILVDWLETDPTSSGSTNYLIIGDLNAYDKEDPIDAILEGPDNTLGTADDYTDLIYQFVGEDAYSYVFNGQFGYLDHALASANLQPLVTGATVWHINADEPDLIDYDMSYKQDAQDALYAPDAYRSSDHDPVVVGLQLNTIPLAEDMTILGVLEDITKTITLTASDADGDDLTYIVNYDGDGTLIQESPNSANWIYTPAANYYGPDSFTFKVNDGTADSREATVSITVGPVNDKPTFTVTDTTVEVYAGLGAQTFEDWAINIMAGPYGEGMQTLEFILEVDDASLFSVLPSVDPLTGDLSFTPDPDTSGTATITITLKDDGGKTMGGYDTSDPQVFTITILPGIPVTGETFIYLPLIFR